MAIKKNTAIKWMLTTLWIVIGAGVAVLLVAAVRLKNQAKCKGVNIVIKGKNATDIFFIDEKDIMDSIGSPVGKPISSFNLKKIESSLIKNVWVKKTELFFDNNDTLQVKVTEREPVARVFTTTGTSFYIDIENAMLPLNEKFPARVPVFTDFPSDRMVLSKEDSSLLNDIKNISLALQQDTFCVSLFDQIDITKERTFEIVPKIGNNIIVFGDASDAKEKFRKIKLFYKDVMTKMGWSYYSIVNVQYKNEIVAKKKGADDFSADSLRTVQMMQAIAANAEKAANDSLQLMQADNDKNTVDSSMIQQSIQRDDEGNDAGDAQKLIQQVTLTPAPKPVVITPKPAPIAKPIDKRPTQVPIKKPVVQQTTKPKPVVQKPVNSKPVQTTKPATPKAVMPKKKPESKPTNDY